MSSPALCIKVDQKRDWVERGIEAAHKKEHWGFGKNPASNSRTKSFKKNWRHESGQDAKSRSEMRREKRGEVQAPRTFLSTERNARGFVAYQDSIWGPAGGQTGGGKKKENRQKGRAVVGLCKGSERGANSATSGVSRVEAGERLSRDHFPETRREKKAEKQPSQKTKEKENRKKAALELFLA